MNNIKKHVPKPTKRQLEFQDWEFGLFIHFGIRTFYEGHIDWDGIYMPPDAFNPENLDCGQWISTAKKAGMKYAVLTAKHHDGFANWQSKYTDYSVASTPWKNGKGDVVKEFLDACRKYDMRAGLYYSPADFTILGKNKISKEYDDYIFGQIGELITNYGKIDLLWFDGCGSEKHEYDWGRIIPDIRQKQPDAIIFNMGEPDYRWIGNEAGIAPAPCYNAVDTLSFSIQTDRLDKLDNFVWLPAECDMRMREANWFFSEKDEQTVKSVDELLGCYYYSIGRGTNLLLNIGPDRGGLLPEKDGRRLLEFGNEISKRFSSPLATIKDCVNEGNRWVFSLPEATLLDHVILMENIVFGEAIESFRICAAPHPYGSAVTVYEGRSVGHKAICCFPAVKTCKLYLEIIESKAEPALRGIDIFYV